MITALVLSAGRSTRMGTAKAWLRYGPRTFLEHIVGTAVDAGVNAVVVVAGCEEPSDPLLVSRVDVAVRTATLRSARVARISVAIGRPDGSPIDSIRTGFDLIAEGSAVLLWPIDCPFADVALLQEMFRALGDNPDCIVVPSVGPRHGHPVLFGRAAAGELLTTLANSGAQAVVHRSPKRVVQLAWGDPRVCVSVNTREQAREIGAL